MSAVTHQTAYDAKSKNIETPLCEPKDVELQIQASCREEGSQTLEAKQYVEGWRLLIVIGSLYLGTLLVALDTTIIFVAVPKISTAFHSLEDIGWYGSAYLLTVMAFQASSAKVFKFFAVKATYMVSILIFEVGSVICATAPNSPAFIVGRALAGIGAAGLFQGALCIISLSVRLEKRPLFIGVVVSSFGVASCLGPILGGVLTDRVTWRWCFYLNVPCGAAVLLAVSLFLRLRDTNADRALPIREKMRHMDPLGTVILIGAVTCLLLNLQWGGQTLPWNSPRIIGLFVTFGVLVIMFGMVEFKLGEKATIPLRIVRQRSVLMGAGFLFFNQMANYINNFYMPFYFQAVQGTSVTLSGVRFLPYAISLIVGVVVAGAIASETGHYVPLMILGEVICAIGTGLLMTVSLGTPTAHWASFLATTGLGLGMGMQMPYTAIQVVLSEGDMPVGNAIAVFSTQLGGATAISAGQSIFVNSLLREIPRRTTAVPPQSVVDAGALGLQSLTKSPQVLQALQVAYAKAVDNTLLFSLCVACAAIPFALSMEFYNVKKVAKEREAESGALQNGIKDKLNVTDDEKA